MLYQFNFLDLKEIMKTEKLFTSYQHLICQNKNVCFMDILFKCDPIVILLRPKLAQLKQKVFSSKRFIFKSFYSLLN